MRNSADFAQNDDGRKHSMIAFGGNPLDRAGDRRGDPAWLAAQFPAGLFLPFWQNRPLVIEDRAGFLPWRTGLGRRNLRLSRP